MSRPATCQKATCIFTSTFSIYKYICLISLLETRDLNTILLIVHKNVRMNKMQHVLLADVIIYGFKCKNVAYNEYCLNATQRPFSE